MVTDEAIAKIAAELGLTEAQAFGPRPTSACPDRRLDLIVRMIGRPPTSDEEQDARLADYNRRGFSALDLTPEIREAIVLVEMLTADGERSRSIDTSWLGFRTVKAWGRSFSVEIANEVGPHRSVMASIVQLMREMERRGLVVREPHRAGSWSRYSLTDAGRTKARMILGLGG